jgi:hypothetical protein
MSPRLGVTAFSVIIFGLFQSSQHDVSSKPELTVQFGSAGVRQLTYRGEVLEDTNRFPTDNFHIWHLKMTDLSGKLLSGGQYNWGENNDGHRWDQTSQTWTYSYRWGLISVHFSQSGDTLNMQVTEQNRQDSGVILDGAVIYPLGLHFPNLPAGFRDQTTPQFSQNEDAPGVMIADYGTGEVATVIAQNNKPIYSGFQPAGNLSYFPLIASTPPDGLATFQPHGDVPVLPGKTEQFTVSLRFAPAATAPQALAPDAYQDWFARWPSELNWPDRRIIGTIYLANSPQGDVHHPGGYPGNPRRYFNNSDPSILDVRTANGLAQFQSKILAQAERNVENLKRLGAQGAITWDIEGEEYPQDTSYVCEPDQIATIAPEMESLVTDPRSRYRGMKLDDAYFKTMHDAGLRTGVCVRPQHFNLNADRTAQQVNVPASMVYQELLRKMTYAHDRWGVTLFYMDSTVDKDGRPLDANMIQRLAKVLPDCLLIPEESTARYYAYAAPFKTFLFHRDIGTDALLRNYYRSAFSVNMINDVDASILAASRARLVTAVRTGDILMVHADYWQANNDTVREIYRDARNKSTNHTETNTTSMQRPSKTQ